MTFLSNAIADQQASTRQQAIAEIGSASEHLTLTLEAELSALQDPQSRDELTSDLERRKREAEEALAHTALWQQVLGDGITDVSTDVEHDLQSRFRRILQRTEEVIDRTDPTKNWAEIGAKLEQAVANSVGNNFVWAHQRAMHLAAQVAETFAIDGLESVKMPRLRASEMGADLSDLKSLSKLEAKQIKLGHKAITGLRGSYGGVIMFGMLTSVAGLGMFNLISLGAGAMLGKKTYNEDMENRMLRIRARPRPTCAGSSMTCPSWCSRNHATGCGWCSGNYAIISARSPTRPPDHSTSRCRPRSRRRGWKPRSGMRAPMR